MRKIQPIEWGVRKFMSSRLKKGLTIWDLDGTLLDTIEDLGAAGNHALERLGYPTHDLAAYKGFVGNGVECLTRRMLPQGSSPALQIRALEMFNRYYDANRDRFTVPYSGISEILAWLRERGIYVAVCTNKPEEHAKPLLNQHFPGKIDFVVGSRAGLPKKPNPQGLTEILARFREERSRTLYIGDSDVDMETGKAAGLYTVGVTWGYRGEEALAAAGADALARTAGELEALILERLR